MKTCPRKQHVFIPSQTTTVLKQFLKKSTVTKHYKAANSSKNDLRTTRGEPRQSQNREPEIKKGKNHVFIVAIQ